MFDTLDAEGIPTLLAAIEPGQPARVPALHHLARVATGGAPERVVWDEGAAVDERVQAAVAGAVPRLVAALEDEDAAVRGSAAYVLALVPRAASAAHAGLVGAYAREVDPCVRASVLLALGRVGRQDPSLAAASRALLARPVSTAPEAAARPIACAWLDDDHLDDAMTDALVAAEGAAPIDPARCPWGGGDLGALAARQAERLATLSEAAAIEAMIESLTTLSRPRMPLDPRDRVSVIKLSVLEGLALRLLVFAFGEGPAPAALTPTQASVLRAIAGMPELADSDGLTRALAARGLSRTF